MNLKPSFKLLVGILFGILVIGDVLLGILSFRAKQKTELTLVKLKHSYLIVEQLDAVSLLYKDVLLGSAPDLAGGYRVDSVQIEKAREQIGMRINSIKSLVADNKSQLERTDLLEGMLEKKFIEADSIVKQVGLSNSAISAELARIMGFGNGIGELVSEMKLEEGQLISILEMENQKSMGNFSATFYKLLVAMGLILVLIFLLIILAFDRGVRLQKKMKQIGELYEKFFNDSPIGMIIVRKRDGLVIESNKAYGELLNCTDEEIMNKPPVIFDQNAGIEQYESQLSTITSLGKVKSIELQVKPKDRVPVFTSVSIQPISVREEPCILLAIQDMSLYKKAEEEMQKALVAEIDLNKMKTDFITLASHELRTPLSTILSSAFLIESYTSGVNRELFGKHLARIRSSVSSMTFLVDEFLTLTGIEKKSLHVNFAQLDIKTHMEILLKGFDPFLKKGQQIRYDHEGETLVFTDPVLISNIVNILVSNSVKFSAENSLILISTKVRSGFSVKVKDFGIGIPLEDQHRVFDRFFRGSNSGNIQGVGLGLHIMKNYVDLLQGKVSIKSKPNEGTEVLLNF